MNSIEAMTQCGICEEEKEKGILLYRLFICHECEQNMIHTEPREEKYNYYLQKLKNMNQPGQFRNYISQSYHDNDGSHSRL